MKVSGIIRRIDDLGRIVIPREIRKSIGVREGDPLEMFIDEETGGLLLKSCNSKVSSRLKTIAENLSSSGMSEEVWEIADELKVLSKKLEKIEKSS